MSDEFNIKKSNPREIKLTREDFNLDNIDMDDINIDALKDENLDDLDSASGSINFTKENMDFSKLKNIFRNDDNVSNISSNSNKSNKSDKSNKNKNSNLFNNSNFNGNLNGTNNNRNKTKSTREETKTSVNIKKKNETQNFFANLENNREKERVIEKNTKKKPIVEPTSVDLGLDILANQNKRIKEPSVDFNENDNHSNSSLGEFEQVKNIMDGDEDQENRSERSYKSNSSEKSKSNASVSELSSVIKDKINKRSHLTDNQRKEELLFMFNKLEKKGFKLNQKFTMRSSLEDMELIYQRLEHERNVKNSIKFQRKVLMGIVSTLEFVNTSFNPFDVDLEGWSESVMENYTEYDDIFEELYEKYKDKGKISPEVRLLMTLAGSAFYFHLSKTIIRSGAQRMTEIFGGPLDNGGPIGNSSMNNGASGPLGGLMSGFMNNFMNAGANDPSISREKKEMKGPQGFDDILSNKSDDIPSIHSNDSLVKKKKRTLAF